MRRDLEQLKRRSDGPWRYVGDPNFTPFINGRNADPSALIPNPSPLKIRFKVGGGMELKGDVTDLAPGDIICNFPEPYRPETDTAVDGHDDDLNYVPSRVFTNGDYIYGVP
jgi:hypothetical protein